MLKKILIITLSIIDAVLLFFAINHFVAGFSTPSLVGASGNAYFMGYHIVGIVFASIFTVVLICIIMICLYMKPKGKQK